jgi:acyl-CoA reductase-like NAD-dependent aldehyde dehydrogenase
VSLSPVLKIPEFFEFLEDALSKGADLLCGGHRANYQGNLDHHGQFLIPTVIRIKDLSRAFQMRCMHEENFFPLIPLIRVSADTTGTDKRAKDMVIFKKMVHIANHNEYGLRISAWATSPFYVNKFAEHIQNSGLLRINCRHAGFSPYLATHGGTGRTGGPYGELNYVWQKTSHLQGVSIMRTRKRRRR